MNQLGDIPEPAWWSRCREMKAQGYGVDTIAERFSVSRGAVDHVLYREQRMARRKQREAEKGRSSKRQGKQRDHKRLKIRQLARERWRNEQYSKPLEWYYRELDCL